ncbi:DUF1697 domain-containing protein [Paenibacillus qinlingensis]|uniref:Uncharacterized protein (DUF1697 family) n=1 Tax=Paenibacillus qinlingensis TaxID=1837343 RepID=A0ABU1NQV0_9BACL|nr:DUF1697 domain-containing protein [Paenibacillus qinlingensis]MDR6549824.1 uncharacterized protein (DUF1697 family) [Paenibacillus qinlingensis]
MPRYIAMLRGINVSGQKIIKMDRLRQLFESLEFTQVSTYIQSGNVIFDSDELNPEVLRDRIVLELKEQLTFDIPVIIRTPAELEEVVSNTPYVTVNVDENEQRYVTFLSKAPTEAALNKLQAAQSEVDEYHVTGLTVFLLIRKNYGESKFSNNFIEKKLGVAATTRNWETVNKLIQLAGVSAGVE